jgi:ArsR family transcriptional regulator
MHQVLHFLHEPGVAVAEAARLLRLNGRLLIVDFAPHELEFLRDEHAHRRLGFADKEVRSWCCAAGLDLEAIRKLNPKRGLSGQTLTVKLWFATPKRGSKRAAKLEVAQ